MKLALIGFGNLGRGFSRVLLEKAKFLKNFGITPRVIAAVDEYGAAKMKMGSTSKNC